MYLSLAHVRSENVEKLEFWTYTADSHQEAIKIFRLDFWGAVKISIFIYSV